MSEKQETTQQLASYTNFVIHIKSVAISLESITSPID